MAASTASNHPAHHRLVDRAHAADPEGGLGRELAAEHDEAALPHQLEKALAVVVRVGRGMEGRDHRRCDLVAKVGLEAERAQAVHEATPVAPHALEAPGLALLGVLAQRRDQRRGRLRRRGEPPAPVVLEAAPLPMQIQAEGVRAPGGLLERGALRQHQPDARHALEPFVGRCDDGFGIERPGIDRQAAERCDRIHDQGDAASSGHLGERLEPIEQTGAGVHVADHDMADRTVGCERRLEPLGARGLGPRQVQRRERQTDGAGDLLQPLAVEAVAHDQQPAFARHQACRESPRSPCCRRLAAARRRSGPGR